MSRRASRGPAAGPGRDETERLMLAEARTEVAIADAKASTLLATLGIGFGALLAALLAGSWDPILLMGWARVLWWTGAVAAAVAVACVGAAVWPRFSRKSPMGTVHYWGHVAQFHTLDEAAEALDARADVDGRERTRDQLWRLSRLVARKYTLIRWALGSAAAAGALLLGSAALPT